MVKSIRKLGKERLRFCCSSSISNFKQKLLRRLKLKEYRFPQDIFKPVIFFGLYHWVDYLKFLFHFGKKKVFWCGSDLLKINYWKGIILLISAEHYVENNVERRILENIDIFPEFCPMIFDHPSKYQVNYKHSNKPKVFGTYHKGREKEYGVFKHPQIDWFCDLSEEEFNEKIKDYQGCVRLNRFDGFAESLAKSVLMGQYQWSEVPYKYMTHTVTLEQWLKELKYKKKPNYRGEKYWRKTLEESLKTLLTWQI